MFLPGELIKPDPIMAGAGIYSLAEYKMLHLASGADVAIVIGTSEQELMIVLFDSIMGVAYSTSWLRVQG